MERSLYLLLSVAFLLAGCTQEDEAPGQGNELPYGEYPLQIGSVSLSAEAGEQPWTRVAENEEGNGSVWQQGDEFQVKFDDYDDIGTYLIVDNGTTVEAVTPIYWKSSTQSGDITAWYTSPAASTDGTIDLSNQSNGLAYVLQAKATATLDNATSLDFNHQLAKVRVELSGTQAGQVETVKVFGYTSCTHDKGTISTGDATPKGWITMHKVDDTTYEANVVPGTIELTNFIQINERTATINDGFPTMLQAATMYTINLTVGEPVTDITEENATISGDGHYRVSGNFGHTITVTGGKPNIYLEDANINVNNGDAISITGDANATIHITGNNTVQNTSYTINGAGIYVEAGSTVAIEGTNRNTDVLTAIAANDAAGIGGNFNGQDCGNIHIHNVTVVAKGDQSIALSPGIGSTGNNNCGQIIIDNATVHAYGQGISGTAVCPAIGPGFSSGLEYGNLPMVTIRNESEVHAHRGGGNADYIGYPYKYSVATGAASTVNLGQDGTCTSSTIYCYTGDTLDKTVEYDDQGNDTEVTQ